MAITVDENTTSNIGSAFSATDADGDNISWSVGGTDASSFGISRGQLPLASGATLDYETQASYSITVIASDDRASNSVAVTVTVTDDTEAPGKVGGVTMTYRSPGSFDMSWDAPANNGPEITNYKLRWREAGTSTPGIPISRPAATWASTLLIRARSMSFR